MTGHKKKSRFMVLRILTLTLVMIFGLSFSMASASAEGEPTETTTATETPVPQDDSSPEAPAAPEPEVVQKQAPVKAQTPESDPKEESQTPPKDEEKANKPDPKPETVEEGQVCGPLDSGKIDTTGDPQSVTVTAPDGRLISGYCVKAGSVNSGDGPIPVEVDPPQKTVTITYEGGKAVSHYSLSYVPEDVCPELEGNQPAGTDCNPVTKIDIPAQPTFKDPCGPNNVSWNVPDNTDTLSWDENDEGNLVVTIIEEGVTFTDDTTTHDFGIAPDSGEACPVDTQDTEHSEFCGGFRLINPEGNPALEFTYSDTTQGGANSESVTIAGGEGSDFLAVGYSSAHVVVEGVGGSDYFDEYNVTIPQGCDVVVTAKCGEFTATNMSNDVSATFFYTRTGDEEGTDEHQATLEPGASLTVKTAEGSIDWFADFDDYNMDGGTVKVEQKCDTPPPHGIGTPTSEDRQLPDTGGSNLGLLALGGALVIAGGGITFAGRRRTSNV